MPLFAIKFVGMKKKKLFELKIVLPKVKLLKRFKSSRKEKTIEKMVLKNKIQPEEENINVSLCHRNCKKHNEENQKITSKQSECASCFFGDPSFSCTCNFQDMSPDFKLYDGDVQFMYYNNAFFC